MSRVFAWIIVLAMCLGLCACAGSAKAPAETAPTQHPGEHVWEAATCLTPQICSLCGETMGEALGHTPGEWTESTDIVHAKCSREQTCSVCGTVLETEENDLTSFSENNMFIFSPQEFLDRFTYYATEYYPEFHYEIDSRDIGGVEDAIVIHLYLDAEGSGQYNLYFLDMRSKKLPRNDLQNAGVRGITMESIVSFDKNDEDAVKLINGDVLFDDDLSKAFYLACDPILSDDDYKQQQAAYIVTYFNWVNSGDSTGYNIVNELFYAFQHSITERENQYVGSEAIWVYASVL